MSGDPSLLTVWKFVLELVDDQEIWLPAKARVLTVAVQHGRICIWALLRENQEREPYRVSIRGTGHNCDCVPANFYGTVQLDGGSLVFHVFGEASMFTPKN